MALVCPAPPLIVIVLCYLLVVLAFFPLLNRI